jgi:HEAT repeat protein
LNATEILLNPKKFTMEERIKATFQLLVKRTEDATAIIAKGLEDDPSPIVRHECAYSLGEVGGEIATNALVKAIETDKNSFVVHEAALALGNLGQVETKHTLQKLLEHSDYNVILTAKIALQRYNNKVNNENPVNSLEQAKLVINDLNTSEETRIQASFILMEDASEDSLSILVKALHSEPDPIVAHEIIFSLGETASYQVVPELIKAIKNSNNPFVIHEALLALATIGDPTCETILKDHLKHDNTDVAETAVIALERLLTN